MKQRTPAQKAYDERLAQRPCVLCELIGRDQEHRTTMHHVRAGQGMSMATAYRWRDRFKRARYG